MLVVTIVNIAGLIGHNSGPLYNVVVTYTPVKHAKRARAEYSHHIGEHGKYVCQSL